MYLDSKDFQTVWNLAHNWTGDDPESTDPQALSQEVKESIYRIMAAIFRSDLPARTKRFPIFEDESFFTFVFDFGHLLRFRKCLRNDTFDKHYLNSIYVRRPGVLAWCEKEYLDPPPIWRLNGQTPPASVPDESDDENQGWYDDLTEQRKHRVGCLEVAKRLWTIDPGQTYVQIYSHPDMKKYGNPSSFSLDAFKKWSRPFASDYAKSGGRRKESEN